MATFTVNFDDGTSHTYDNVPDDVTQEQVNARAQNEFSDKTITGVNGGEAPAPVAPEALYKEPTTGEKIIGGAQTALGIAAEHPLLTSGAAVGAAKYQTIKSAINQGLDYANANAAAKNAQALSQLEELAVQHRHMGTGEVPEQLKQAIKTLHSRLNVPVEAPTVPIETPSATTAPSRAYNVGQKVGQAVGNTVRNGLYDTVKGAVAPTGAPTTGPVSPGAGQAAQKTAQIAATQGPSAVEATNFIENLTKKFAPYTQKVAPVLGRVAANPVVQGAGRVLSSPITLGAQLMAHSPDLGPAVPSAGPYRGMEINPNTHRPWTKEELDQYNAFNK